MITLCGQILVSRTDDGFKKRLRVNVQKSLRVYRHHAHMCFNMCAWCRYTRGRLNVHGHVLNVHTGFSDVPHTTTQDTTQHNNTTTSPLGDRERQRQGQGQGEKRRRQRRDKRREDKRRQNKTRQEKTRQDKNAKRREKMKHKTREEN